MSSAQPSVKNPDSLPILSETPGAGAYALVRKSGQTYRVPVENLTSGGTSEPTVLPGNEEQYWRGDKVWTNFAGSVRSAILTGLSTASSAVAEATDSVLTAIGKLQAQISLKLSAANPTYTGTLTGGTGVVNIGSGQIVKDASGNVTLGASLTVGAAQTEIYPRPGLTLDETQHATSNQASMRVGSRWMLGQDAFGSGVRDFFVYDTVSVQLILVVDTDGSTTFRRGAVGYGPGAGGTVTQATGKSTAVTLHKPSGQITMHNAALAAGASVTFDLNNTLINPDGQARDTLIVVPYSMADYRVEVAAMFGMAARIRVTNVSGISLSDALVISFAIIKGDRT